MRLAAFAVLATMSVVMANKALTRQNLESMSTDNLIRGPLTHIKRPAHLSEAEFKGAKKYQLLADGSEDFPEFIMLEDFLTGFIKGTSYLGDA